MTMSLPVARWVCVPAKGVEYDRAALLADLRVTGYSVQIIDAYESFCRLNAGWLAWSDNVIARASLNYYCGMVVPLESSSLTDTWNPGSATRIVARGFQDIDRAAYCVFWLASRGSAASPWARIPLVPPPKKAQTAESQAYRIGARRREITASWTFMDECHQVAALCASVPPSGRDFADSVRSKLEAMACWADDHGVATDNMASALSSMRRGVNNWIGGGMASEMHHGAVVGDDSTDGQQAAARPTAQPQVEDFMLDDEDIPF